MRMNSIYRFLETYGLGDSRKLRDRIAGLSEKKIDSFFNRYLEAARLRSFVAASGGSFCDVFPESGHHQLSRSAILQLALYVNRIYVHDPILELFREWRDRHVHPQLVLMFKTPESRLEHFRERLEDTIAYLLYLQPLVELEVIYVAPTALVQPIRETHDIYLDDFFDLNGSVLDAEIPESIVIHPAVEDYCNASLQIFPARLGRDGILRIVPDPITRPTRTISLAFAGEPSYKSYMLGESARPPQLDGTGAITMGTYYDIDGSWGAPDPIQFSNWIQSCRRKVIFERVGVLELDLTLAQAAQAHLIITSTVSRDIVSRVPALRAGEMSNHPARSLLSLKLPQFGQVTPKNIARARRNVAGLEDFRLNLERSAQHLCNISDPHTRRIEHDKIVRELITAPLTKVQQELHAIDESMWTTAFGAFGTLAIYMASPNPVLGLGLLASGFRLLDGLRSSREKLNTLKTRAGFFYWEASGEPRAVVD